MHDSPKNGQGIGINSVRAISKCERMKHASVIVPKIIKNNIKQSDL